MVDYGKVRSTVKPDEIVIDEFSVWQHTNIPKIWVKKMNSWAMSSTWFSMTRTNSF